MSGDFAISAEKFAKATEIGRRRTQFSDAPETDIEAIQQAMIEREPVTVVISEKGLSEALAATLRWAQDELSLELRGAMVPVKAGDNLRVTIGGIGGCSVRFI